MSITSLTATVPAAVLALWAAFGLPTVIALAAAADLALRVVESRRAQAAAIPTEGDERG